MKGENSRSKMSTEPNTPEQILSPSNSVRGNSRSRIPLHLRESSFSKLSKQGDSSRAPAKIAKTGNNMIASQIKSTLGDHSNAAKSTTQSSEIQDPVGVMSHSQTAPKFGLVNKYFDSMPPNKSKATEQKDSVGVYTSIFDGLMDLKLDDGEKNRPNNNKNASEKKSNVELSIIRGSDAQKSLSQTAKPHHQPNFVDSSYSDYKKRVNIKSPKTSRISPRREDFKIVRSIVDDLSESNWYDDHKMLSRKAVKNSKSSTMLEPMDEKPLSVSAKKCKPSPEKRKHSANLNTANVDTPNEPPPCKVSCATKTTTRYNANDSIPERKEPVTSHFHLKHIIYQLLTCTFYFNFHFCSRKLTLP